MNSPLTSVGEEPCFVADMREFLIQVNRLEIIGDGDRPHHFFKLEGLILSAQEGGSGSAGGWDWGDVGSCHFIGFVFVTTYGSCGFFARKRMVSFLLEEESMHTTRLTSSSSDKQILFVTSELVSRALDC